MPDFDIFTLIKELGLTTVALAICLLGFWRIVVPAGIKAWQDANKERLEREELQRKHADEARQFLLGEIRVLREDARADKQAMQVAFMANIESNTKLERTLDSVNRQLRELTEEIGQVKADVSNVYRIIGKDKALIKE